MKCEIRPWSAEDAPRLAEMLNNKQIQDNLRDGIPFPYTLRDAKEFITAVTNADPKKIFAFVVTEKNNPVGSVGIFCKENIHFKTAALGYYIAQPFWNKGYATDAVTQACRLVFGNSDIIRIFAEPFARNRASCRVLEKAGFIFEGTMRDNSFKNGQVCDMQLYALLRDEFHPSVHD